MSRAFIDKHPGIFDLIKTFTGVDDIITFKKYEKGELYYGNTDGRDIFKGKDLNVIGTPHQPEWM
jgi:cytochrome b involved in lipid metabolism